MKTEIERILKRHKYSRASLIAILQDIQAEYNYLPEKALRGIAEGIGIPFSKIFSAATFFRAFSLKPRGKHLITVCLGTACHVRGGVRLVEEIGRVLEVKPGETTDDQRFTLETVNCLGCCALGPLMTIGGKYFGNMSVAKVGRVLEPYRKA